MDALSPQQLRAKSLSLHVGQRHIVLLNEARDSVGVMAVKTPDTADGEQEATARYIEAAYNACSAAGLTIEDLANGGLKAALRIVEVLRFWRGQEGEAIAFDALCTDDDESTFGDLVDDALAKVRRTEDR